MSYSDRNSIRIEFPWSPRPPSHWQVSINQSINPSAFPMLFGLPHETLKSPHQIMPSNFRLGAPSDELASVSSHNFLLEYCSIECFALSASVSSASCKELRSSRSVFYYHSGQLRSLTALTLPWTLPRLLLSVHSLLPGIKTHQFRELLT